MVEYPLETTSPNIVWQMISTAEGLQKWIANQVTESDGSMTFKWGEPWTEQETKTAIIIEKERNRFIRMKWDHDDNEAAYWEMRIEKSELTGHLALTITDFADDGDKQYLYDLWNDNMKRLHEISGL